MLWFDFFLVLCTVIRYCRMKARVVKPYQAWKSRCVCVSFHAPGAGIGLAAIRVLFVRLFSKMMYSADCCCSRPSCMFVFEIRITAVGMKQQSSGVLAGTGCLRERTSYGHRHRHGQLTVSRARISRKSKKGTLPRLIDLLLRAWG